MPNLESLEARFLKGELDESNDRQPYLALDKLRTLLVDDTEASTYTISKLILPLAALKCLIRVCRPYPYNSFGRLLLMLNHSKPPLEHLEISDYDFTNRRLDNLLRLFPELKTLYMVRFGITCSFFDKLCTTYVDNIFMDKIQEQFVLCPKLRTLHFKDLRWIMRVDYCLTLLLKVIPAAQFGYYTVSSDIAKDELQPGCSINQNDRETSKYIHSRKIEIDKKQQQQQRYACTITSKQNNLQSSIFNPNQHQSEVDRKQIQQANKQTSKQANKQTSKQANKQ
ncbi:uncharacterized protein FOMMEDRAFT_31164 [Fomitiporia mediterranea MF3/22]|uniref:uncharacterized protein n=1 Tax=Fomitiporia mediterranea (strain MF3/22) TaxID=694068 RepID=UPI00044085E1|nr:uncharacterized protein FOMMEDRAFT_31164 [Fomitiporia mediterranea MF3/22]EJC99438.1 hypothetical protein FOMMEDRAFT_31164 [Fomitiporia mediterranea MF3/22]